MRINPGETEALISGRCLSFPPPDWNSLDLLHGLLKSITEKSSCRCLETKIKDVFGSSHAVVTNLGRTALTIGLRAMGLGKGAGVILPATICPTVIRAVIKADCRPILVDVEQDLHLSCRTLRSCDLEGAHAVIVAHLYGLCAPIEDISDWAKASGLRLIDDAAQAVGVRMDGKYLGTFGDLGILSFGPFKSLGTSRGGALICNDSEIIERVRKTVLEPEGFYWAIRRVLSGYIKFHLRPYYLKISGNLKQKKEGVNSLQNQLSLMETDNEIFGLSNLETELVSSVLKRVSLIIDRRRKSAHEIWNLVKGFDKFEFVGPSNAPYVKIPIRLSGKLKAEETVAYFRSMKIEAERIYRPLHLYSQYEAYARHAMSTAEENWEKVFLIPNPVNEGRFGIARLTQALQRIR